MKLYLRKSLGLLCKTLPFVFLKLLVYILIGLFFAIFAGLTLFFAFKYTGLITIIIVAIGLIFLWIFVRVVKRYVLYLIKAGHIAVLGELVQRGQLPPNTKMLSYGFQKVKSNFLSSSIFFVLDGLIHAVVQGISNFIRRIGEMIPIPSVQRIFDFISKVVSIFLGYIDEAILSFIFIYPDKNPWRGARDGLILYFKAWKSLLPLAAVLVLISYFLTFIFVYAVFLLTAPISAMLPFFFRDIPFLIALIIAFVIKVAFLDQYSLVAMIVAYQESIKDLSPDNQTMEKLEQMIPEFREIMSKAGRDIGQRVGQPKESSISQTDSYVNTLIPHIKNMRAQGYNNEQIKKALVDKNWPVSSVEAALRQA